ncbi:MAG: carboxypeptidase regulatory-like domain-containing protein [Candidatus Acidiferrales bacterium]
MRFSALLVYAFVLALVFASFARAQNTSTGSISGVATDNTGAVIPGGKVTVSNGSGAIQTGTTGPSGEFLIGGLAPGSYKVTVSVQGFADFQATDVVVAAGQTARVEAALVLAGVTTSTTVQGQSTTQIETESSEIAGTVTQEEVVSIGLNGRNFTQLVALAPGVSNQTGQDEALVGVKGSVKYSVNGGRTEYNTFDIDGGDVLNAAINGSSSSLIVYPSLDALNDMQVLTSNYGAMYGRSASGTILATTKSGTNSFHGDAYFFARNNIFNSRNYFDLTPHAPLYQKYDPGGTIGGPVYIPGHYNENKDKTFFFWSEEYRHDREPVDFNQAVPSNAERNCQTAATPQAPCLNSVGYGLQPPGPFADFSDVCPALNGAFVAQFVRTPGSKLPFGPDCPAQFATGSTVTIHGGTYPIYQTYPYNLVPIGKQAQILLGTGVIPLPTSTKGCNSPIGACYDATISPLSTWRQELFRIDQNFTPKLKGYFRYIHDAWETTVPTPQWAYIHNSAPTTEILPTIENDFVGPGFSLIAHFSQTISSNFFNDMAMAFTTDHISLTDINGPGATWARPAGLSNLYIFNNGFGGKVPGIVIGGNNQAYGGQGFAVDPGYMPWKHSNPTYSPRDDATWQHGKHVLDFGILAIIAQRNEINPPVGATTGEVQGILYFSNLASFNTTGNAFADLLVGGLIQNFQQDSSQLKYHNSYNIVEPYVQDDWHVTSRLTLNLGLRFSLFGTYREQNLNSYNWVASAYNANYAAQVNVNPQFGNLEFTSTGAAVPLGDPHLTNGLVRCGVDRYANGTKVPVSCMSGHVVNPAPRIGFAWDPFGTGKMSIRGGYGIFYEHGTGNEANTGSLEGSSPLVESMTQYNVHSAVGGPLGPGTEAFPLNVTSIPTKAIWPYAQQWSLSVQRDLPWNLFGTVAYVGSKGTHLTAELQINQLQPVSPADNPFAKGQPLLQSDCQTFVGGPNSGFIKVNGQTFSTGQPIFSNLEAACSSTNAGDSVGAFPDPNALRTFAPGFGQIYSLQNVANSNYNALQFTLRHTKGPLTLGMSYSYSHSIDDASDRTESNVVNAYNLAQNRASSDFDQRHLLNIDYIYDLPLGRWIDNLRTGWTQAGHPGKATPSYDTRAAHPKLLNGWKLSGVTTYASGTPFSVLNAGSANGVSASDNAGVATGVSYGSYPDRAATVSRALFSPSSTTFGPLLGNPNSFVAPQGLTFGNAGRNSMNNPSRLNFDTALIKDISFNESYSLEFRAEVFNIFNHTQFRIYDPENTGNTGNNVITCYGGTTYSAGDQSCLATSAFLHPVDAHRPRTMQFGVKLFF